MRCFTGRETFVCTFEKDETSCLLTNEYTNEDEMELWHIVDGRGVVTDNTLGNGLSTITSQLTYLSFGLSVQYPQTKSGGNTNRPSIN